MTIKDIAKISGYGVGTVSRVINDQAGVSEKAREAILNVIMEQNFEPNMNARHLKRTSVSSIAIIVKGTNNLLFSEIVEEMQTLFTKYGENATTFYIEDESNEVDFATKLVREQNPKAIVFFGVNREHFNESFSNVEVPCVIITNTAEGLQFSNLSSVTTPDEEAAKKVAEYLVQMGHTRIGIIGGNKNGSQISEKRIRGAIAGLAENGVDFDINSQYIPSRFSAEAGYHATVALLEGKPETSAIFALGDIIAHGVIRAITDLNKKVPEDISVIGFDGLGIGEFSVPRLTTIVQDTKAMAKSGVDIILQRLDNSYAPINIKAPFTLRERESVRRNERIN